MLVNKFNRLICDATAFTQAAYTSAVIYSTKRVIAEIYLYTRAFINYNTFVAAAIYASIVESLEIKVITRSARRCQLGILLIVYLNILERCLIFLLYFCFKAQIASYYSASITYYYKHFIVFIGYKVILEDYIINFKVIILKEVI